MNCGFDFVVSMWWKEGEGWWVVVADENGLDWFR
jgi:hypothetical protein